MNRENVETIYRLSPAQQGMLFHTLYAPGEGVYFEQFTLGFGEGFDPAAFERAWQELVDRNPVLRTSFAWEGLAEPVQIVHRRVQVPFEVLDWRAVPEADKERLLAARVADERRRGFDLTRPPLVSFVLIRLRDDLWRVIWNYHHLVLDGWSTGILRQEAAALYAEAEAGRTPRAQQRRPFRDYIAWLRQQDAAAVEGYWRRTLAGFTAPTPLGIARGPRASGNDDGGEAGRAMQVVRLPAAETAGLKDWARRNRLTLSTVAQGAWALLLARWCGEEDVVFGLTVSGRPPSLPGVEAMLGCFVNTLPVRVRLPADRPVLPWLAELQAGQAELRKAEHSPLVDVQGWSEVPRPTPLFESLFVVEGFQETVYEGVFQRTNYPLVLVVGPDDEMVLRIDFELERIEPAAVARALGHLQTVLAAFQARPEARLAEVDILTAAERRQLLAANDRPVAAGDGTACLHRLFEAQAARRPDAPAVTCEGESRTYRQLNERANRLAHALRRLGVGPDVRVGLCLERGCALVEAILGILKAGGAYVPLDPHSPAARLELIAADAGLAVLVTAGPQRAAVAGFGGPLVDLDVLDLAGESAADPEGGAAPGHLAYVIYTSGSTGRPKGSLIEHRQVTRLFSATAEWFGFGPGDVWTLFHSFAFDFSVWEIWGALLHGGRLVVVPYWVSRSPEAFHALLAAEGVTVLNQTPSAFLQLSEADGAERAASRPLADLRLVVFGGEALEPASLAPWFDRHGDRRPLLVNMYGITETTVHVSYRPLSRADLADGRSPLGVPIPDLAVHVRDRQGHLLPVGVAGEMYIGGEGLARGYLGRPDLTAERFVPDPFGAPGARLYRTGDLARRLADGGLEYLGRTDHQVKIRGFRIELGEIEAVLAAHPGVAAAVVLARDDAAAGRRLVAWVVPASGGGLDLAALREHLRNRLPDYMVPAALVELPVLPLTAHGKVDRRALPEPSAAPDLGGGAALAAPRTPVEELVAGVWAEVLGVERVGRDADFFDLGGHSLLATRVVSRLRESLGVDLPLRDLFKSPSVAELARLIEAARAGGGSPALQPPPLQALPRHGDLPLSFAQERLWFLDRLQPGTAVYTVPAGLHLRGRLDVAALGRSLAEVARRHEALRTVFAVRSGRPVQEVRPDLIPPLPLVDLAALPAAARLSALRGLVREEPRRPFDLAAGPLLRQLLVRAGAGEHVLLVTLHHIVADGWSLGIFVREMAALYAAFCRGLPSPLPELPLQYADFARWQREWLRGEVLAAQTGYWRRRLAGAPGLLQLPADRPRPPVQRYQGGARPLHLPAAVTRALGALGRRHGATPFMTLLAGLAALLARATGEEDLVVGTPIAGRTRLETEGLIGFFLNALALRVDAAGRPGFAALLARAREVTLDAFAHQDLPFEKLVEELAPERSLSHAPVFQVQLVLQNQELGTPELPGLELGRVELDSGTSKFDLTLSAGETPEGLAGYWFFNRDLLDGATVERLSGHFRTLLAGAVAEPERPFADLPLLAAAEQQQLREWNATAVAYGGPGLLHAHVEAQADRTPDAPAVLFAGAALTYRQLDAWANRLAHRLIAAGVGPETLVGVCAERSPALVAALLAVLKAGGAYVPLDPASPPERLAYMLADAGAPVLLAEPALAGRLPAHGARVLPLEDDRGGEAGRPAVPLDPDALAYVIYTSGSTGRPKGAMNSHRGIVNRLLWMQQAFGLDAGDRVLQKTPFGFDVSVWEFFWPLMTGACLVVARPGGHQDPAYLVDEIAGSGVTTLHFVPSMLQVFLGAPGVGRCAALRRVVVSGEALPADLQRRFFEALDVPLHNLYGPTEAAVDVSWWPCEPGSARVPIGRPVANTELHVLDREGRPAPVGVAGELCIGGVQVGRGYHGRPALTAERFVPDPFGGLGARLYRTGDLARHLADGALEFLGRLDHQVKIRGVRIELGEIEAALAAHPAVHEAVVVARPGAADAAVADWRLVAYVVGDAPPPPEELRAHLAASLPEAMIPAAFVTLEALPLNPNGKVDRGALPVPEPGPARPGAGFVAPRGPLERLLAELWSEVLGGLPPEQIGVHDGFFELGGNSITGAVLINRLQERLGEIVHVVALFDAPTIARLAAVLERDYPRAVARLRGEAAEEEAAPGAALLPAPRVTAAQLARLRGLVRAFEPSAGEEEAPRNPRAVLLLSPPRSGSTLLRVMLGGNPRLFAPPELELLPFRTLAERRDAFPGRDAFRLEGLLRAVMELCACGPEEAKALVRAQEDEGWSVARFYRWLQDELAGRLLVDKTPTYAWDLATLRRAEALFEEPLYLHLVRHPFGAIRSFEEARLDQVFFGAGTPFSRRELAELSWLLGHRTILEHLRQVPAGRRHTVHFERLLRDPAGELGRICAFLGVAFDPAMAAPYEGGAARMTDGLYAASRMAGDVKFHQHRGVDAGVAERWRDDAAADALGDLTLETAGELGIAPDPAPLSFAQERLWFLDQLDPGTHTYNVTSGVRLSGRLDVAAFAAGLDAVVRRHAVLRTTFAAEGGQPVQVVHPRQRAALLVADLRGLPAEAREAEARRLVADAAARPFDLARGPLLRALLLRLDEGEHAAHFTVHHIVCDGWSLRLLTGDLAAFYAAETARGAGRPAPLPELPLQYADWARWQRRWLQGERLEAQVAWWRGQLSGVPVLQLPLDRPRPAVQTFRGSTVPFAFPPELAAALGGLAQGEGATLFVTVLAGFQGLLHRLAGQDDLAVGAPVAGRSRREIEPLIGFFVNTLALRADLAGEPDGRAHLARTRAAVLGALAHQDVPFERIVQEVAPERTLNVPPVFQVMLAFQNGAPGGEAPEFPGLALAPLPEEFTTSKFDLSLTVFDAPPGLFGQWVYNVDLFDRATVARWAGCFQAFLEALAADPGRPLADLPLLGAAEREEILVAWNRPAVDYPDKGFVHRLFEEQAARTPEAVALVLDGEVLRYNELDARANRLALRLRGLGVGAEAVVGVCAERSFAMVVGLLAVLKAGGAYLPLDPELPEERLRFLAADAGVSLLLAQERFAARLPAGPRLVLLDREEPAAGPAASLDVELAPGNAAYVLYTSGSTGRPKGVVVSHRSLGNRLQYARTGDVLPSDAFLQRTTISFDVSLLEIFAPLAVGGRSVLVRPGGQQDLDYLVRTLREQGVTYASFPPSMLAALCEHEGFAQCTRLRTVITGGETVPPALPGQLYRRLPGARLFNRYGPTEATISVTSWRCEREAAPRTLPIGRPTAKARVYLVDRHLQPMPVGGTGEILLGGLCVTRGYLRRPALTAQAFIPDPFSGEAGGRLYRTGDLARWREDGALEFAGRVDQQVKIRGFRVEMGEIEAALGRHPAVREAVVADREDGAGRSLAAYLVLQAGAEAPEGELRGFLLETLPAWMVPADFVVLERLPLSPTGKVDRKALPAPARRAAESEFEPPRTPAEELVAELWAGLLGRERIGVRDDFFALGGHSLLATQLASRVREAFAVELPLRTLFEQPTLAGFAAAVDGAVCAGQGLAAPPLLPVPRDRGLPLSFAQERLWFLDRLQPGLPTYNLPAAVRLVGRLDVAAFRAGLQEVVRRHEVLRTTFALRGGRPVQVIADDLRLDLPLLDLRALPPDLGDQAARRLAVELARRPFDLAAGPLLRALLVRTGEEEHLAVVVMHHAVADGWSVGVLIREIAAIYRASRAGAPPPLPALPVQYADFAVWQRGWLRGEVLERQIAWWRGRLAGAPPLLALPADRPRPPVQRFRGGSVRQELPEGLSRDFREVCRRAGATPFMALLAALAAWIHRVTGRQDVIVGTPVAGRDRLETEGLIGFFLNSLALRIDLGGDPGLDELLARVRAAALAAFAHQAVPFEKLVEELAPERNLSHAPLFQLMLVFQNLPRTVEAAPDLAMVPVELESGSAKLDLTLNSQETSRGLVVRWLYNSDLFDAATIERSAGHLETLLAAALADPGRPLSGLPLLTPREERQLLAWNATARPYPADVCLHELIAAQAARTPGAVAVTADGQELTYRELAAAAGRLAVRLRELGVGPDVPVGVCAERSLELVVALVAVLQAGGAYLPLDPDYPAERLEYMLADAAVPVLLTQQRLAGRLPAHGAHTLLLDGAAAEPDEPLPPRAAIAAGGAGPDHLAYVIYTSGSTGRPKGTMNSHRGIVNRLLWMQEAYGLGADDRVLQKTPFSFDVSVWEFFWPLITGARLVVARPGAHRDSAELIRTIAAEAVTTVHFVPSMLQVFVEAPGVERCTSLRRVICSGEALPLDLERRFFSRLDTSLFNLYGPTEAAVDVTHWTCERAGRRGVVPIGHPVANTTIHLLDARLQPVPVGVPGELHIGGVQVGRGYRNRPRLTAAAFVPDPFAGQPGARLYKTGDLARRLPDGAVDFLGRIDHQVKVRGLRIELGEIEAALAAHPALREAVVLARRPDGAAGKGGAIGDVELVAYAVPAGDGPAPTLAALRADLARGLPEHMLPSALVLLDALPLTPSGKADRRALARIAPERAAAPAGRVAPQSGLERHLAGLWSEVLGGLDPAGFGVHDSFFDLGGNSITAAIFINRLQETLGEIVHVVAIFDTPTIAGLAAWLTAEYAETVASLWPEAAEGGPTAPEPAVPAAPVDEARIEQVRRRIRTLAPAARPAAAERNPPAVFVLSPPRSGSTLLRVMLGGNPRLFAPPELELLNFETLSERRDAFPGRDAFRLEGLLRAVMEVRGCGPDEAREAVEGCTAEGMTTRELYRRLQEWIGGRLLVDKTPTYAWDPAALRRAEEAFDRPRYLHLVRHPYGMIHSFEEARIDQIFFPDGHGFGRRELAEALWVIAHRNVLEFLAEVPGERQLTLHFEDLLAGPERELRRICAFLGIDFHPDMAQPYKEQGRRMTDGLHAESRMLGDVKFHQHREVDRGVAERWRTRYRRDFLGEAAWRLAARLGYDIERQRAGAPRLPASLVKLRPGASRRPLFLVHPVSGELLLYRQLVNALGPEQEVFGFQARGFQAGETPLETIEEMADLYVASLLALQPEGPYLLAGSSMGGVVAFEMARRLAGLGREVALTVLVDAPSPAGLSGDGMRAGEQEVHDGEGGAELYVLHLVTGGRVALTLDDVRALPPDRRLELILEKCRESGGFGPGIGTAELGRLVRLVQANRRALRSYRPAPAELPVTYVRAAQGVRADAAWGRLALAGVEVHEVPGNHLSMHAPPHVAELAACLRDCIERSWSAGGDDAPAALAGADAAS